MIVRPYSLPESLQVQGVDMPIRTDYRAVLDVIRALNDAELDGADRAYVALAILYRDLDLINVDNAAEAFEAAMWFVSGGETDDNDDRGNKDVRLMDWEQDFPLIVAPINKAAGCEVRAVPYMHWWTFLAYYREIGECAFSTIVSIRQKKKKHKKMEKWEEEFYRENRSRIDLKCEHRYSDAEDDMISRLVRGGGGVG